ncbi:PDZ domain-containing protein [Caldicellulosiruptor acetigenus]|uniref:PDZ domain-containing protein n=1 Tax=Caldicellulosiruptor acetigenus TaxID=301953 RepID=UPI000426C2A1|nr:PDZ domain-containing protein [Caldicellulosiruptor acetigenus]WAM37107.1 PDZ domain-containing protein [Caldicellulosiruptor acetigenus]
MLKFFWQIFELTGLSIFRLLFSWNFWVVVILISFLYRREQEFEQAVLGHNRVSLLYKVVESSIAGLVGGYIVSLITLFFGIVVDVDSFMYLWYIALILALINPRYLCFSYAAGIISVISLIFKRPAVDISGILVIVAILHFVESLLIFLDGFRGAIPVVIERRKKEGIFSTSGAYLMQRFWAIPMVIIAYNYQTTVQIVKIELFEPSWWPLFKPQNLLPNAMLLMTPIVAALGYGDLAVEDEPAAISKKSAGILSIFSIVLFILSALSYKVYAFKWVAALFAPIAHESIILYQQKKQKEGDSIFEAEENKIKVLYVEENSVAAKMGIKPGDTIVSINGIQVQKEEDIERIFTDAQIYLWVKAVDKKGKIKELYYQDYENGIKNLGIVVVTKNVSANYQLESDGYFIFIKNIARRVKNFLFNKS